MEAKYEARKQELLEECTVAPQVMDRVLPRPVVEDLADLPNVVGSRTLLAT